MYTSIVLIDSSVVNVQKIVHSFDSGTAVVVLNQTYNGVAQIAAILQQFQSLQSINIISHGSDGVLKLGNGELNHGNISGYADLLRQWGSSLVEGGDILLYGCDVAATEIGKDFVQKISELTAKDVAASDDLTGNQALGGDWVLENQTGEIADSEVATEIAASGYENVLAIYTPMNSTELSSNISSAILSHEEDDVIDLRNVVMTTTSSLPTITGSGNIFFVGSGDDTFGGSNERQILSINTNKLVAFDQLTFSHGLAKGGDGTNGGGGGLGAGGALFINQGKVALEDVTFSKNKAQGGSATGKAGGGGSSGGYGGDGGNGGEGNITSNFKLTGVGTGGTGSHPNDNDDSQTPLDTQHGKDGSFGTGGGGAGGGGGDTGGQPDFPYNGGNGGKGGFGGGGGGGGGGGDDDDDGLVNDDEDGNGGAGGIGGTSGGAGAAGVRNGAGGAGGGGAGLGGAVFVRDGATLVAKDTNYSGNSVQGGASAGNAGLSLGLDIFFESGSSSSESNINTGGKPTLSLSVEEVDPVVGDIDNIIEPKRVATVTEGYAVRVKINVTNGQIPESLPVHLWISQGSDKKGNDYAGTYKPVNSNGQSNSQQPVTYDEPFTFNLTSNNQNYEGHFDILINLDKEFDPNESFTISLLPSTDYLRAEDTDASGRNAVVNIENINYAPYIDIDNSKLSIQEVADGITPHINEGEINVDDIESLGYVTVKLNRPVAGEDFNNALAAGLLIRYQITPKTTGASHEDYLSSQYNYNNSTLGEANIVDGVIVPVDEDEARIYFAALPDVVKEEPEKFTLELIPYNDPSLSEEYQYYLLGINGKPSAVDLTITDGNEFPASFVVVDSANGEIVSETNPLVPNEAGEVKFKVKLQSKPTSAVTITAGSEKNIIIDPSAWDQYKEITATAGSPITVKTASGDTNFNSLTKTLKTASEYTKIKIGEGDLPPDSNLRTLYLNVVSNLATTDERGTEANLGFTINLSQPIARDLTVNYTLGGTAVEGTDYEVTANFNGTVTIPAYSSSFKIPINVIDNEIVDGPRNVSITLSKSDDQQYELQSDGDKAEFAITNDDQAAFEIVQTSPIQVSKEDLTSFNAQLQVVGKNENGWIFQSTDLLFPNLTLKTDAGTTKIDAGLLKEVWYDVKGADTDADGNPDFVTTVDGFIASQAYGLKPSEFTLIPTASVENTTPNRNNMGVRVSGYITAPTTGEYEFSTTEAGYQTKLYLRNNDNDVFNSDQLIEDRTKVTLTEGKQYFLQAIAFDNNGSQETFQIKWKKPEDIQLAIIDNQYLSVPTISATGLLKEFWNGIEGLGITNLTENESYLNNNPTNVAVIPDFNIAPTERPNLNNFGTKVSGYITAPISGNYKFFIAANSDAELKLNQEGISASSAVKIAEVTPENKPKVSFSMESNGGSAQGTTFEIKSLTGEELPISGWKLKFDSNIQYQPGPSEDGKYYLFNIPENTQPLLHPAGYEILVTEETLLENGSYQYIFESKSNPTLELDQKYTSQKFTFIHKEGTSDGQSLSYSNVIFNDIPAEFPGYLENYPNYQQWDWNTAQQSSDLVFLEQGKKYYIEAIQKEGIGADHLSVAWQLPGNNAPEIISQQYLSPPTVSLPIFLDASQGENNTTNLQISDQSSFDFADTRYQVSGLTLEPDTTLNFLSGFVGKVNESVDLVKDYPTNLTPDKLKPIENIQSPPDATNNPARSNIQLIAGYSTRLGLRLKAKPTKDVTIKLNVPGNTFIKVSDDADGGTYTKDFTFTAENWDEIQGFEIQGIANSNDQNVIITAAVDSGDGFKAPGNSVTISVIEANNTNSFVLTLASGDAALVRVGFDDTTLDGTDFTKIKVLSISGEEETTLDWIWSIDDGELLASDNGQALLKINLDSIEDLPGIGRIDSRKINVELLPDFFTTQWAKETISVQGIQLYADTDTDTVFDGNEAVASVNLTLNNGYPTVEAHYQLSDVINGDEITYFSYTPTGKETIVASVALAESIPTEYGLLQVNADKSWTFEPNIELSSSSNVKFKVYTANDMDGTEISVNIPAGYEEAPHWFTSQVTASNSLPNKVSISADNTQINEGATGQFTITLDSPAAENTVINYTIEKLSNAAPTNIALKLDSTKKQYLSFESIDLGTSATLEMWVRSTAFTGTQSLLSGEEFQLILSDNQVNINGNNIGVIPTGIQADEWFHLAYTFDGSTKTVYVNGEKIGESTANLPATLKVNKIGKSNENYFSGQLDEIRIWNNSRTQSQVQDNIYSGIITGDEANFLKGHWSFNELGVTNQVNGESAIINNGITRITREDDPDIWAVRQSATDGIDYDSLSGFGEVQRNLLELDAGKLGRRSQFTATDFDGDGDADIVLLDGYGKVTYFRNQSIELNGSTRETDALFIESKQTFIVDGVRSIGAVDLDNDGKKELIVLTEQGQMAFSENLGNGQFASPIALKFSTLPMAVTNFALADLNGDGKLDLFTLNDLGKIKSYSYDNAGFRQQAFKAIDSLQLNSIGQIKSLDFSDLDKDGKLDLFVTIQQDNDTSILELKNYGTPEQPHFISNKFAPTNKALRAIDDQISYENNVSLPAPYGSIQSFDLTDFDGDGKTDLLYSDIRGIINLAKNESNLGSVTIKQGETTATVSLTTHDDEIAETTEAVQIRIANDGQGNYATDLNSSGATIEILDNDSLGVELTGTLKTTLTEGDISHQTYSVKLKSQPTDFVYLKIATSSAKDGLVAKEDSGEGKEFITLVFSPNDWNNPQNFDLVPQDDLIDDGDVEFKYLLSLSSGDLGYNNFTNLPSISVTSQDNDQAGYSLSYEALPSEGGQLIGEGVVNAVKVTLNSQPIAPVSLTLSPDDQITLYPSRQVKKVSFTSAETLSTRTFTRAASGDSTAEGKYGTLVWKADGTYTYTQTKSGANGENFSFAIDDGYGNLHYDQVRIKFEPKFELTSATETLGIATWNHRLDFAPVVNDSRVVPVDNDGINDILTVTNTLKSFSSAFTFEMSGGTDKVGEMIFEIQGQDADGNVNGKKLEIKFKTLDPNENSLSIAINGSDQSSITTGLPDFNDGQSKRVWVDYDGSQVKVYVADLNSGKPEDSQLALEIDLNNTIGPKGTFIINATNNLGNGNKRVISNWELTTEVENITVTDNDNGEGTTTPLTSTNTVSILPQDLTFSGGANFEPFTKSGNLLPELLPGTPITLTFDKDTWQLGKTIAVAAIDDNVAEYNHTSHIALSFTKSEIEGKSGLLAWNSDGSYTYTLGSGINLQEIETITERFYFTQKETDGVLRNHSLDLAVTQEGVMASVDAGVFTSLTPQFDVKDEEESSLTYGGDLTPNSDSTNITGLGLNEMDGAYNALPLVPIEVNIEDNDKPIARASVNLNAVENTHPGYFTITLDGLPVGDPSGIEVKYIVYGSEDAGKGATAEKNTSVGDPGPDFQGYTTINTGTVRIPFGKNSVSLPIFPRVIARRFV
jgi:hypothetical protein